MLKTVQVHQQYCSSHKWLGVITLKKVFRAFLLHKMTHPYCKLLQSMICWMKWYRSRAEYKHCVKTLSSGILYCGTSWKAMQRIMKCTLILITVNIIIYSLFSAFLTLAHDISYVEWVCKILNEWLHIGNWKPLIMFLPKTFRRSGEAIATYGRLYNAFKIRTLDKKRE